MTLFEKMPKIEFNSLIPGCKAIKGAGMKIAAQMIREIVRFQLKTLRKSRRNRLRKPLAMIKVRRAIFC
jgi:hypothetical protein